MPADDNAPLPILESVPGSAALLLVQGLERIDVSYLLLEPGGPGALRLELDTGVAAGVAQ